jgi:choline dehydrogenase-like flavoprotein
MKPPFADGMKQFPTSEVVDVVVIGTGAGAAPVLATLGEAGLSVVALEAGRWWNPAREYAADEPTMSELYWLSDRLSGGETPTAFGGNNSGTGVGGSMLHWGAFVPRADPRDLKLYSDSGHGVDFPLSYADLVPFYEEVERFVGVSGPAHYVWDQPGQKPRSYPLPPVPLNGPAIAMWKGCEATGIRISEAPLAALSRNYAQPGYDERQACVGCGFCHQGCVFGAKASMDVTYLPRAVRAGVEIRANSFVHGFERDGEGRITAVIYRHEGQDVRQPCRAVYLCAGGVETPRLLLHTGLANSSGQVGRNFMVHVATQVWGTFADEMRMNKGFPASVITEDTMRPADADFAGGYLIQSLGVVPVTFGRQVARGRGIWGQALVDYLDRYNHIAGIGINGDCLPYERNFLELADEVDETGMRRPLIHFSYGENERRMSEHGARVMAGIWAAAGATDIWTFQRSAHTIGTCRMGDSPETSVVDPFGRSHDIPNLWISDNSTFPAALAANPALTIMALALRSARRFLETARLTG